MANKKQHIQRICDFTKCNEVFFRSFFEMSYRDQLPHSNLPASAFSIPYSVHWWTVEIWKTTTKLWQPACEASTHALLYALQCGSRWNYYFKLNCPSHQHIHFHVYDKRRSGVCGSLNRTLNDFNFPHWKLWKRKLWNYGQHLVERCVFLLRFLPKTELS